jgi:hypothetical protein
MNNDILAIWANIEQSNEIGLLKRLYTNDSELYIYAVFQNPERHCGIALSFDKSIRIDVSSFSNLRDLQVVLTHDNSFDNNNLLVIKLVHYQSCDVFAVMCENMIQSVLGLRSEKQVVRMIIGIAN